MSESTDQVLRQCRACGGRVDVRGTNAQCIGYADGMRVSEATVAYLASVGLSLPTEKRVYDAPPCETRYRLGRERNLCSRCPPRRYWWQEIERLREDGTRYIDLVTECEVHGYSFGTMETERGDQSDAVAVVAAGAGIPRMQCFRFKSERPSPSPAVQWAEKLERPITGLSCADARVATEAAAWCAWLSVKHGVEGNRKMPGGRYVSAADLARKSRFKVSDVRELVAVTVLVVDRIGEMRDPKGYVAELLLDVLGQRQADGRRTLLVSRFKADELFPRVTGGDPNCGHLQRADLWALFSDLFQRRAWVVL